MRGLFSTVIALLLVASAAQGCASTDEMGKSTGALARPGPWRIPASTVTIGDRQTVTLTEAGPWIGPEGCSGTYTPGARELAAYIAESFPGVSGTGGYNCRPIVGIPDEMSVHATGRAIDIDIPTIGAAEEADNDLGDPIGNWLIEHAEEIGIQRVIWDRWTWWSQVPPGYSRSMPYDWEGSHPHNDHLHIELSVRGGNRLTTWFGGSMEPPTPAGCAALGARGGVVDDSDPCFQAFGNPDFWRLETTGYGGSSIWTNAWQSDRPGNWGRWGVRVSSPGDYRVEVNTVAGFAVYSNVRYLISHAGTVSTVYLDQSATTGWRSLGEWRFGGGTDESVAVYDNSADPVASGQRISVDALRLTWAGADPPPPVPDAGVGHDAGPGPGPTVDAGSPLPGEDAGSTPWDVDAGGEPPVADAGVARLVTRDRRGGCAVAAPGAPGWNGSRFGVALLALSLLVARRRRR